MKRALHFLLFLLAAVATSGNIPRTDCSWTNRWSTTMELTQGTHQLTVSALHPSGFFTTNATVWFTNNVGQQTDQISRDGAGQITQRSYTSADGAANHTQALSWDYKGRLCNVLDCDAQVLKAWASISSPLQFPDYYESLLVGPLFTK